MTVKRPMLLLSAALVAGMYLFALLNAEASLMVLFLLFLTTIVACIKKRQLYTNLILICAFLLFLSGYFYYALKSDVSIRQLYNDCGKQCTLTGEVVGNIEETDQYIRFFLKTKSIDIDGENRAVDEKISAICFKDENSTSITPTLNRGDVISLHCKLELPSNAMNTNGFNYRSYYKSQGVYFEAIANATQLSVVGHQTHTIKDAIHCFRTKCTALFDSTFPKEESGILKAYIVGETSDITQEIKDAFSISGLSHVLSISGMHVAVFISSFTAFLWFLKIPKRKQMVLSVCAIVLFVIFTGGSIATIRAGLVCLIALFAQLVFRHSDPMTALAEAAAVLCIWNPFVILDASFLLSFSATFGIILFSAGISQRLSVVYRRIPIEFRIRRLLKTICDITAVGISANLFIIPILVSLFNQFSIVSILATIAITPLLTPVLVGGLLFCMVGLVSQSVAYPIAGFLYLCAKGMILVARGFAAIPFASISWGKISPFILLLYIIVIAFIYFTIVKYNKRDCLATLYAIVALLFVFTFHYLSTYSMAKVYFINVGQGDCSLIDAPGNCEVLIDAGGNQNSGSVGEYVVKPYLLQNGILDLEYVIASHGHADHVNGLARILDTFKVKHLLVPMGFGLTEEGSNLLQKATEYSIPITYLKHGDILQINDNMRINVIMPDKKFLSYLDKDNENDRSLLLKLEYGNTSFLYTGDLSLTAANYAAAIYPELLTADVLKVAHHGSDTSNSQKFLEATKAKYAYIPVGENNYGQPDMKILKQLKSNNISYYRADLHHDVCFYFDQTGIKGVTYNKELE